MLPSRRGWFAQACRQAPRHDGGGPTIIASTKHEFIRQAIKEAVERMKPELHAASEAAHQLFDETEAEDQADFERTVELGYVVDRLANFCGPNLAVLYELACALDEFHGTDEQELERPQRSQPHRH
jgi:hypothetical protein